MRVYNSFYIGHALTHFVENAEKIQQFLEVNFKDEVEANKNEMYPTLEAYYNLLPKELRSQPNVIAQYLNLEKRAHWLTLEQKQHYLNREAWISRPKGKYTDIFGQGMFMTKNRKLQFDAKDWFEYSMPHDDGKSINSPKRIAL